MLLTAKLTANAAGHHWTYWSQVGRFLICRTFLQQTLPDYRLYYNSLVRITIDNHHLAHPDTYQSYITLKAVDTLAGDALHFPFSFPGTAAVLSMSLKNGILMLRLGSRTSKTFTSIQAVAAV